MRDAGCGMQDAGCRMMPQGHSHETTELKLLFLSDGMQDAGCGIEESEARSGGSRFAL
jgi:hypothetical protein